MRKKDIDGFENYTISEDGTVTNKKSEHKLKHVFNPKIGYYAVGLSNGSARGTKTIHRLVALAFVPNPDNKREVNHIDGNKVNNSISNLEWVTHRENGQHAYDNGLNHQPRKITDENLEEILERFFKGETLTKIVEDYDFVLSVVSEHMTEYVNNLNLTDKFNAELVRQKAVRAKTTGRNRRHPRPIQMLDIATRSVVKEFNNISEAGEYLNKKTTGPIHNALSGRQKTAYGFKWVDKPKLKGN